MAGTDDSDIPESGAVFTFGKSKFAKNLPNKFWVRGDKVLHIACGDEHTALVAGSGRIFVFGPNDWGQLGIGASTMSDKPTCIKSLKTEKVKNVACGRSHTVVSTESGTVYTFGSNSEGQLGVEDIADSRTPIHVSSIHDTPITMVAAGADHSLALADDGRVLVWGGGSEGQLGLGKEDECPIPRELPLDSKAIHIACGYYHTAVVTEKGQLYTFGESEGGKLGLGDTNVATNVPQLVPLSGAVKQVACGNSHTIILTADGDVYSCGMGENGQLGHGTQLLQTDVPVQLKLSFKVISISCGENHTAIISERGQLFTFGDGRHGKLALGQETFSNQFVPFRVSRFAHFLVSQVSCGGCHMVVLARPKIQNGDVESEEEEEEEVSLQAQTMNLTLKSNDLEGSLSARLRRRQSNLQTSAALPSLNQTLPPLGGGRKAELLNSTLPILSSNTAPLAKPRRLPSPDVFKKTEDEKCSDEGEEPTKKEKVRELPKPLPRGSPSKSSKSEEEPEKEEEHETGEEKEERLSPVAAVKEQYESDVESVVSDVSNQDKTVPVPTPRKGKLEGHVADSEETEGDSSPAREKKKDKKKKKGSAIFGKKETVSDEEGGEEEDKKEAEEEKEETDEDGKKEDDEKVEKKEEKEDKKTKSKKKVKEKEKKDKKKDKKGKKKKAEEEDEEDADEDSKNKNKKKDKKEKDKKKDKKKKQKEGGSKEENDDDEDAEKNDKDEKDEEDKEEKMKDSDKGKNGSGDHEDDAKNKKEKEEKPKKSRTCSIL